MEVSLQPLRKEWDNRSILQWPPRVRTNEYDFRGIPASSGIYGIHSYPAMFHFLLVRSLIEEYSRKGDLIFDPYTGSGVVCGESLRCERHFVGCDINPLALLIARVRTTIIPLPTLLDAIEATVISASVVVPGLVNFKNIGFWFPEPIIDGLSRLKASIRSIGDRKVRYFMTVAFSDTVRKVSNTRYNEFKLFRRKDLSREFDVIKVYRDIATKYANLLNDDGQFLKYSNMTSKLNNRNILSGINVSDESVDLVVTSPPYGDSRTTVAYGQFSRLPLQWLDIKEEVDRTSLGAKPREIKPELPSDQLYRQIEIIGEKDQLRAREVYSFYYDLYRSIRIIARKVKRGGHVCFVVGNRRVKSVELETDVISTEFFQNLGFTHKDTRVRAISNKRMPSENSPSNIPGEKDSTMKYEYIVVLERH